MQCEREKFEILHEIKKEQQIQLTQMFRFLSVLSVPKSILMKLDFDILAMFTAKTGKTS